MASDKKKNGKLFVFVAGIVATVVIILNILQVGTISNISKDVMKNDTVISNLHRHILILFL